MRENIGVFIFTFCFIQVSISQNAYYTAKAITDSFIEKKDNTFIFKEDSISKQRISGYLQAFLPDSAQRKDLKVNQVFSKYIDNPFIGIPISKLLEAKASSSPIPSFPASFENSSVSGLNITKFANALADLMIERAKQELTIAFFNRFKNFAKKNPEFQTLFPKTTDNLSNLLVYTYPQMLPKLREGFFEDIKQITYNLEAFLELPRYKTLLENLPEIRVAIRSLKLMRELENEGITPDSLIRRFAAFPELTENNTNKRVAFKNTAATVQFAALLSESLRSNEATKIWISPIEARGLINDDVFAKIYLGLLYQQVANKNLNYYLDAKDSLIATPLKDLFAKQKDHILLMQNRISQFLALSEKVNDAYLRIKEKNDFNQKNTNEDFFNYISVSIDIVDYGFGIARIFSGSFKTDNYITIAKRTNSLYKNIYSKKYTLVVDDVMSILKNIDTLIDKNRVSSIEKPNIEDALSGKDALNKFSNFVGKLSPYAIFMGNMIEANDESQVKAALENVVLPVGSSTIKKNTSGWWGNIAIQSYLGGYGSTDHNRPKSH